MLSAKIIDESSKHLKLRKRGPKNLVKMHPSQRTHALLLVIERCAGFIDFQLKTIMQSVIQKVKRGTFVISCLSKLGSRPNDRAVFTL